MSETTDKAPGTFSPATAASLPPHGGLPPRDEPAAPPKPDTAPKRPTTRAGRKAAAEARRLAAGEGKPKADKTPKASTSKPRKASLETRLAGSIATTGTMLAAGGSMLGPAFTADGVLVVQHSASIAAALDKVAKDDPRVAAALERMLTAGVWSGLVAAMLPLVVGIAANHGAIPQHMADLLGVEPVEAPTGGE